MAAADSTKVVVKPQVIITDLETKSKDGKSTESKKSSAVIFSHLGEYVYATMHSQDELGASSLDASDEDDTDSKAAAGLGAVKGTDAGKSGGGGSSDPSGKDDPVFVPLSGIDALVMGDITITINTTSLMNAFSKTSELTSKATSKLTTDIANYQKLFWQHGTAKNGDGELATGMKQVQAQIREVHDADGSYTWHLQYGSYDEKICGAGNKPTTAQIEKVLSDNPCKGPGGHNLVWPTDDSMQDGYNTDHITKLNGDNEWVNITLSEQDTSGGLLSSGGMANAQDQYVDGDSSKSNSNWSADNDRSALSAANSTLSQKSQNQLTQQKSVGDTVTSALQSMPQTLSQQLASQSTAIQAMGSVSSMVSGWAGI